ncbi:hypothetical protein [Mycobacterium pseudokansasii]|uniref:hypothetical protein n=1 Tax=Mycobacterium pseudokansasii TaxID=2341080 RepID=UPI0010A96049|nr:hypothetical protein [Mycobacterium pseudokansasii]
MDSQLRSADKRHYVRLKSCILQPLSPLASSLCSTAMMTLECRQPCDVAVEDVVVRSVVSDADSQHQDKAQRLVNGPHLVWRTIPWRDDSTMRSRASTQHDASRRS